MEIKYNHRKWVWAKKIIHKFRAEREMLVLYGENLKMYLIDNDIVKVKSDNGCCMVYIPKYDETLCFICG